MKDNGCLENIAQFEGFLNSVCKIISEPQPGYCARIVLYTRTVCTVSSE